MNKETIKIGAEEFTYDILKKECLAIEMMPVAGNEERLASMPHIRFFDIAATYHYCGNLSFCDYTGRCEV